MKTVTLRKRGSELSGRPLYREDIQVETSLLRRRKPHKSRGDSVTASTLEQE